MNNKSCNEPIYSAKKEEAVDPALLEFCIKHGIRSNNIRAGLVSNGWRGILATSHIAANECILRVPRNILFSCESARRDAHLIAATTSTCPPLSPLSLLAVHLLHEVSKGPASLWEDYLCSLPPSYTTAISLSPNEVNALQVPYAQRQVANAAHAADTLFIQASLALQKLNLPLKWRSKSAWVWALSTLSSRTMFLATDPEAGCLTPFGDLFNYAPPEEPYTPHLEFTIQKDTEKQPNNLSNSTFPDHQDAALEENTALSTRGDSGDGSLDTETNEYCIYARKGYFPGEEIFLCYGRYTNVELLEHYGFVLQGEDHMNLNPHDTAVLPLGVLPEAVQTQLHSMGEAKPSIHANGNPSWQFLRALRLAALKTPAQRKLKSAAILADEKADDISEIWVMKTLIKACQEGLRVLPTNLEHDEALLKAGNFETEGMQMVIQWRVGYKKILTKTIEICNKVLKNLLEHGDHVGVTAIGNGAAVPLMNLNIRQPKLLASNRRAGGALPPTNKIK